MINPNIEVRRAQLADAGGIYDLQRQLAEYIGEDMDRFLITTAHMETLLHEQQQREADHNHPFNRNRSGIHIFVAELNDRREPVGAMVAAVLPCFAWTGARPVLIDDLITEESQRGQGVGTLLIGAAAREAVLTTRDAWGNTHPELATMRLSTHIADNEASRGYYESIGFETDSFEYRVSGQALLQLAGQMERV